MTSNKQTTYDDERALAFALQNQPIAPVSDTQTTAILLRAKRFAKFLARHNQSPETQESEESKKARAEAEAVVSRQNIGSFGEGQGLFQ